MDARLSNQAMPFARAALSAAVLIAWTLPAAAADPELDIFTKPDNRIEFGAGYLSTDKGRQANEYTGLYRRGIYGLLDMSLNSRDESTGTWSTIDLRNFGTDAREARIAGGPQGSWNFAIEYVRTPRDEPLLIRTPLAGIGASTQRIRPGAAPDEVKLQTRRDAFAIAAEKILPGGFDVQVNFRNEEKTGAQLYGQGFFNNIQFLTNPLDTTTRQLDVIVNYASERLQLSGGYYGTQFDNNIPRLDVFGGVADLNPMSLAPGNQSHQFHVSGGYNLTPTTRATFKAAYSRLTQNEGFITASGVGRSDLGAEVNTTLLQAAITARPLPRLALTGSVRYEDRDDNTPALPYLTTGIVGTSTTDGFNKPDSMKTTAGKLEATYELPARIRFTGGVDYDKRERHAHRVMTVGFRNETEETTWRAELRRTMFDVISGSVMYAHAERRGSEFLLNVVNNGSPGLNQVHPLQIADRTRDKVRFTLNWQPVDPLSVSMYADYADDSYSGRLLGLRDGKATTYSLDASYALNDNWQMSAYVSRNSNKTNQSTCLTVLNQFGQLLSPIGVCPDSVAAPKWDAGLRNAGNLVGASLRGKPVGWLEVGADAIVSRDTNEFRMTTPTPGATVNSLPDTYFRLTRIALFAKYALRKDSDLKLSYGFERWQTDDFTWTTWTYSDGTRVMRDPSQRVHFVGLTYSMRWQ